MRLAIVLGSSERALEEFSEARAFLESHALEVFAVCVNDAIRFCPVKPVAFCTIHSSAPFRFFSPDTDLDGVEMFTRRPAHGFAAHVVKAKWHGTSGLYAVQVALEEMGFDGAVLAGCPIDAQAGTLAPDKSLMTDPERINRYRPEWLRALSSIGARTRSMSGWTRELLGAPSAEWLASLGQPRSEPVAGENANSELAR